MKKNQPFLRIYLLLFFLSGFSLSYGQGGTNSSAANNSSDNITYSLFLTGGVSLTDPSPVLTSILASPSGNKKGLVLLGDVIGIDELNAISDVQSLLASMPSNPDETFDDLFLLPGEKEWTSGKTRGHHAILSLDGLLKDVKKEGRLLQPKKGCGTPEEIKMNEHAVLVLMDSQWAIESENAHGEKMPGCELGNVLELNHTIKDIISSYPQGHIIFAVHHPLYSGGPVAGYYPLSSHLLPVPIVGSIITGIKSLVTSDQHFNHPAYEAYRSAFTTALDGCANCIVISGHEKSLQYIMADDVHYLVAGSGSDVSFVRKADKNGFTHKGKGFVRADILEDGHLRLSLEGVDDQNQIQTLWEKTIEPYRLNPEETIAKADVSNVEIINDSVLIKASDRYEKKRFLRGHFYREAWSTEIKIPVLWIDKVEGGLTPVQLGGGNQTRSLRLENKDGEQYVLRSIDKKVTKVLPRALRGTFAENIVQDGIAASHPYGALVLPRLADAAGIYYTKPLIVYVPNQPALGIYDQEIGGGVYLFEDRPGGNTSNKENFGSTEKTLNTFDVLELIAESDKHVIDQRAVLRARLFDVWLGDWDRHDDQWRWASFKENGVTVYRPIPRDRDQVFFKNDGLLDYLGSRPYFNPPLRRFDEKIDYLPGVVWAGKYFDRSFLHELSREDFTNEATALQVALSDEVIRSAFLDWPVQIDVIDGEEIRKALMARRDDLPAYAEQFYDHLSPEVDIPVTDDEDRIVIHAPDDDHLQVTAYRHAGKLMQPFYNRIFLDKETKEVRIYGLAKADTFQLSGDGNPSIRIRTIGGSGKDVVINDARRLRAIAHDLPGNMQLQGDRIVKRINDRPFNNTYDRSDWKLDRSFHFPFPAYFTDEGFGLTYNFWWLKHGFRSDPYQSKHALAFSYFVNTGAFIGKYTGDWPHAFGDIDFGMDAYVTGPTFTQYYYGLGNTYVDFGEKQKYHIVKGSQVRLAPSFGKRFGYGSRIYISPSYQFINLEDEHDEPRFVYTPTSGLTPDDFGNRHYGGITLGYSFERLDNQSYPVRGGEVQASITGRSEFAQGGVSHGLLSGGGTLYIPFNTEGTIVLATDVQADKIFGDYEFFHALTLGGPDRLRGFRRDRFAGDARFYQASDLRFTLFHNKGIVPFDLGVYGAFDYGRVWYEEEENDDADAWHTAFGGGIYIVPLGMTAFRLGYMVGEDDRQINIGGALRF